MSKIPERKFSDLDPSTKKWFEFGLKTLTEQSLPRFTEFFSRMGISLGMSSLNQSGFPYSDYLEGTTEFYGFDDGISRMQQVLSPTRDRRIVWLFHIKEGTVWEDLSARAGFLEMIAFRNRATASRHAALIPGFSSDYEDNPDIVVRSKVDNLLVSIRRLSNAFSVENVARDGFPAGRVRGFQNQVASFHRTAARIEKGLTAEELGQLCRDLNFSPEATENAFGKLNETDMNGNPFPGLLGLALNPGTHLLGLIDGKKVEFLNY